MPRIKVNDIQIYYEVHGEGFPLIMITGLSGNIDHWDPRLIEELSKEFKLVIFDNRGAGRTDRSDREYTIKLCADDTAGLMDALKISRAHVLGLSMGGATAQELALNYPEKVEKLVLLSTSCGGSRSVPPSVEVIEPFIAYGNMLSPEEIARVAIPLLFTDDFIKKNPEFVELSIQRTLRAPTSDEIFMRQLNAIMNFDTYGRLSQIKVPTLILQGKRDILVSPENGLILAEAIPNAKLVYFENSAHVLAEEMEKVLRTLLDFLAES